MASKDFEALQELLKNRPDRTDAPVEDWREGMAAAIPDIPLPEGVTVEPVSIDGLDAAWTTPPNAAQRTLIYFHGGGYALGSLETHRHLVALLAVATGARCLAVDYRLGPEHEFPAAVEDGVKSYRWVLEQGVPPEQIVISGDSAGGGLTLSTVVSLRDAGIALPAACVYLSPWTDLAGTGESSHLSDIDPILARETLKRLADWYLGAQDPMDPLASPLFADHAGLPPMYIQVGSAELLLDDSRRLKESARAAGVEVECEVWDEMIHVWHYYAPILQEGRDAIEKIGAYVKSRVPG